jgi:hypothetical protein
MSPAGTRTRGGSGEEEVRQSPQVRRGTRTDVECATKWRFPSEMKGVHPENSRAIR